MDEIWKPIGIANYAVSNLGTVKGKNGIRILKPATNHHGYKYVVICDDNIKKHRFIHHLVIEAFVGERPLGFVTDHINRIRDDNRLENLRYCTHLENSINSKRYDKTNELHGEERYKLYRKRRYERLRDEIIVVE
jgi:hypothetical protein